MFYDKKHKLYKTKSVKKDETGKKIYIELSEGLDWIENKSRIPFVICQSIPERTEELPVFINVTEGDKWGEVPLKNKYGLQMKGEELKPRTVFKTYYVEEKHEGEPAIVCRHFITNNMPLETKCKED